MAGIHKNVSSFTNSIARINPVRTQRPATLNPWAKNATIQDKNGSVWISMKPRKILDQFTKGAGQIATQELADEFIFLAPLSLQENLIHQWEAYESVASRLAQKIRSAVKLGSEAGALVNTFGSAADLESAATGIFSKAGANEGNAIENFVRKSYGKLQGSRIPKIKVDTPLYYSNSERRELTLEFQLFHERIPGKAPEEILIEPIQRLMKYSSPELKGDIDIEFPYIFEVRTLPFPFIKYTTCALRGVQPTWNSPYINGVPMSCNLTLTFIDMSPLYRSTIERGSIIRIISKETADSRSATNTLATATGSVRDYATNTINKAKNFVGLGKSQPDVVKVPADKKY